ncbi:MAG: Ig-like domain-containing protein [Muribaculaceae bacterium]|nr:Ig-like domain-containing protein [Muribaculaceae bacterium]MBP5315719.1 Ig-like domain-containing protein [Muribaculaceae bacterium]
MNQQMAQYRRALLWVFVAVIAAIVAACASIGRPEGGMRDIDPPVFTTSNPPQGTLGVTRNQFVIEFNENISVDDVSNKVVVSPSQKSMPSIIALGKRIIVELRDTLRPNTTYTIDFGDAIKDLNEGNILDGFTYDFSTGETVDSLEISGMLFEARTLEPAQGMLVGVYSNLADSAITTLPMERIARTNQLGQFTIRNLAPGKYRLFALKDQNRDYHWDRTEDVAFFDSIITPTAHPTMRTDSLHTPDGRDSVVTRASVAYFPNDILLTWFNEEYKAQYLKDKSRTDSLKLSLIFAAPADTLPSITLLNGNHAGEPIEKWSRLNASQTLDTLQYWITERDIIRQDTLRLAATYLRTDSTQNLSMTNDTIQIVYKRPKPKKESKKKAASDSIKVPDPLVTIRSLTGSTQEPLSPHILAVDEPLDSFDISLFRLEQTADTVWATVTDAKISPISPTDQMKYRLDHKWDLEMKYRLTVDSLALRSIYGKTNKKTTLNFSTRKAEDYASLTFNVDGLKDSEQAIVELLDTSDKVLRTAKTEGGTAHFDYVLPGTYYARLFIDRNHNGRYDTGNLLLHIQPEDVFYYNKKINVKKNWDISQAWSLYALPVDLQKPDAIKKNKPTKKAGDKKSDDEEDDDEFSTGIGSSSSSKRGSLSPNLSLGSGKNRAGSKK